MLKSVEDTAVISADQHTTGYSGHSPRRLEFVTVTVFTIWFFATALHAARSLPLWYDEFFTLALARMNPVEIWHTLQQGLEPNPPIGYLLSSMAYHCLGGRDWAIRVPGILSLWTAAFLTYRIVRSYSHAIVAVSVFFLTPVLFGAISLVDARPYPVLLLCSVLAVRFWIACEKGGIVARLGFAASLSAALWTHFASTALIACLAVAEMTWWWRARRVRHGVWAALVLSACTLLPLIPQIHAFLAMFRGWYAGAPAFAAAPSLRIVAAVYVELYLLVLPLTAICALLRPRGLKLGQPYGHILPVGMLAAIPIIEYWIATLSSGAFLSRYCITAIPGILILCSLVAGHVYISPNWFVRLLAALTLPLYCALISLMLFRLPQSQVINDYRLKDIEVAGNQNLPMVVADAGIFPAVAYYASPELKARLLYLRDTREAKRLPAPIPELSIQVLKQWYKLPTEEFDSFIASKRSFLMLTREDKGKEWLPGRLQRMKGVTLRTMGKQGSVSVVRCSFDRGSG